MCGPRGIAAAVAAKNMPPACFLNAPTVLKALISYLGSSVLEAAAASGIFFTKKPRLPAPSIASNCANTLMQYRDGIY